MLSTCHTYRVQTKQGLAFEAAGKWKVIRLGCLGKRSMAGGMGGGSHGWRKLEDSSARLKWQGSRAAGWEGPAAAHQVPFSRSCGGHRGAEPEGGGAQGVFAAEHISRQDASSRPRALLYVLRPNAHGLKPQHICASGAGMRGSRGAKLKHTA